MNRRIVAAVLILVMSLQGPLLAFRAVVGATGAGLSQCAETTAGDCDSCCTHGSTPAACLASCAALVAVLPGFSVPRIPHGQLIVASVRPASFASEQPVPLIRPPIA